MIKNLKSIINWRHLRAVFRHPFPIHHGLFPT